MSTQRIEWDTRNSSFISRFSYNPRTEALTVTFSRGESYRYRGVPMDLVERLRRTRGSVGRLFNRLIKDAGFSPSRVAVRHS